MGTIINIHGSSNDSNLLLGSTGCSHINGLTVSLSAPSLLILQRCYCSQNEWLQRTFWSFQETTLRNLGRC